MLCLLHGFGLAFHHHHGLVLFVQGESLVFRVRDQAGKNDDSDGGTIWKLQILF